MNSTELDEIFDFVHDLMIRSGEVLKQGFKHTGDVRTKTARHDLVTMWDDKIEEILNKGIKERYPTHEFICEEESSRTGERDLSDAPTWIIDSIDGTINFVKKLHLFCISVAFSIDKDLKLAFLYNPILGELYTAKKGCGAFLNGVKIETSKNQDIADAVVAHEFSLGYVAPFLPKYLERGRELMKACIGVRSFGSAALTLGYIAKGAIDAYSIEDLKCWDIAAGALIVQEAGGIVVDKTGGKYNIMKPNIIAAANASLADSIREIVLKVDKELDSKNLMPYQLSSKIEKY